MAQKPEMLGLWEGTPFLEDGESANDKMETDIYFNQRVIAPSVSVFWSGGSDNKKRFTLLVHPEPFFFSKTPPTPLFLSISKHFQPKCVISKNSCGQDGWAQICIPFAYSIATIHTPKNHGPRKE